MCGDTQIEASNLRVAMNKMKESLPGESSYHQQFSVSGSPCGNETGSGL